MRRRGPKPQRLHGLGANLDVMTLSGYHQRGVGLWREVYGENGFPKSKAKRKRKPKCVAWKPVGQGCDCKPVCASTTSKKKGTTKKKAEKACKKKCKTSTRKKRRRN
jgi:hypothetical protein